MKKSKVLIVGSMAFDNIKTHKSSVKNVLGGSASYSSIAASFFSEPKVIAVVGEDFTKKHIKPFRDRGVDTSCIEVKEGKTFTWAASYDKDFKNATTLSTELNVFADFAPVVKKEDSAAGFVPGEYFPQASAGRAKTGKEAPFDCLRHHEFMDKKQ